MRRDKKDLFVFVSIGISHERLKVVFRKLKGKKAIRDSQTN